MDEQGYILIPIPMEKIRQLRENILTPIPIIKIRRIRELCLKSTVQIIIDFISVYTPINCINSEEIRNTFIRIMDDLKNSTTEEDKEYIMYWTAQKIKCPQPEYLEIQLPSLRYFNDELNYYFINNGR